MSRTAEAADAAVPPVPPAASGATAPAAWRRLAERRVYFGHQSVGTNLVNGIEQALRVRPGSGIRIVGTREPSVLAGPAFVHFYAGRNEAPATKNADLLTVLDARPAADSGIALLKYCYVDVNATTDVARLFAEYQATAAEVRRRHPDVRLVHVTMPLTTVESDVKAMAKRLLGRPTVRSVNARRNEYNRLLREAYEGREPLFDLAALESTRPDGSRSVAQDGDATVFTLAAEYTADGGHLKAGVQQHFGERLLDFLAEVAARP